MTDAAGELHGVGALALQMIVQGGALGLLAVVLVLGALGGWRVVRHILGSIERNQEAFLAKLDAVRAEDAADRAEQRASLDRNTEAMGHLTSAILADRGPAAARFKGG